jgi:hypothetical protein
VLPPSKDERLLASAARGAVLGQRVYVGPPPPLGASSSAAAAAVTHPAAAAAAATNLSRGYGLGRVQQRGEKERNDAHDCEKEIREDGQAHPRALLGHVPAAADVRHFLDECVTDEEACLLA